MTSRRWLGAALAVVAVASAVLAAVRPPEPVVVDLPTGASLAVLQASWAAPVPLAVVAVVALVHRGRHATLWALGGAAPIVVVVVAASNGVRDAAALVALYALTAAVVLLRCVVPGGTRGLRLSAVVGVVPWGVVALAQIGGLLTVTGPSVGVRVLTVVVLALAVVEWLGAYRVRPAPPPLGVVAAAPLGLAVLGVLIG